MFRAVNGRPYVKLAETYEGLDIYSSVGTQCHDTEICSSENQPGRSANMESVLQRINQLDLDRSVE